MRPALRAWLLLPFLVSLPAAAQLAIETTESVAKNSPEGWAMRYFAGTTLMTSFGATSPLAPWRGAIAGELGGIPRLSEEQQRVGFGGFKQEDLDKSPVFGRLRGTLGLPGGWVAELGYTPQVEIDGTKARDLVAIALGKRLVQEGALSLSMRALGQVGKVQGDITCPARIAGVADPVVNPVGCQAPSRDAFSTNHYGIDATIAWDAGDWKWHAGAGVARTRLAVQVDAPLESVRDRTKLTSDGSLPWFTLGVRRAIDADWSVAFEILHVPLEVRRPPDFTSERDSLTSWRAQLRREFR
ncbi:MAG: hypothetical protein FIB05_07850 [Betaproteobacteria bacterium]|nr:hypothetical protein [Betaproteobacteria bacterium]